MLRQKADEEMIPATNELQSPFTEGQAGTAREEHEQAETTPKVGEPSICQRKAGTALGLKRKGLYLECLWKASKKRWPSPDYGAGKKGSETFH